MFSLISFSDMWPMLEIVLAAIPVLVAFGMCGLAFFCWLDERKEKKALAQNQNLASHAIPLFNA